MLDYINDLKFDALGREFIVDIFYKYLKDFGLLHTMFDYRENKDTFLGTDDRVYDYLLSLLPEEQVIKNTCLYFNISRSTLIRRLKNVIQPLRILSGNAEWMLQRKLLKPKFRYRLCIYDRRLPI